MFNIHQANFKNAHLLNKMALVQFQRNEVVKANYLPWAKSQTGDSGQANKAKNAIRGATAVIPIVILHGNKAPRVKVTETPTEKPMTVNVENKFLSCG